MTAQIADLYRWPAAGRDETFDLPLPGSIGRTTLPARDDASKERGMVQRRKRDRSLFEVLLPDGHKLWPDWLRKIDTLLEDEAVIEVVAQAL